MSDIEWKDDRWIGCGKSYAECETEAVVTKKRASVLKIPPHFDERRPHPELSIRDMLDCLTRMTQGKEKKVVFGGDLISPKEPNASLEALFAHIILPNSNVVEEMNKEFGQKWFDGKAKSIIDFTSMGTNAGEIRYPLPALQVYREFDTANAVREEWMHARGWMEKGKRTSEVDAAVALVKRLMYVFEWDAELRALDTTSSTSSLLKILNDGIQGWLTDDHIDMLMQVLTDRSELARQEPDVAFASCFLQHYVQRAYVQRDSSSPRNERYLSHFRRDIASGKLRALYFVGNVNGNHWVPWKFDFQEATLCHGDSLALHETALRPLKDSLMWWMRSIYAADKECCYTGNTLPHGVQANDTSSCGIVAYNAIAHDIFGDELWTEKNSKRFRIDAFVSIVLRHNEHPSRRSCKPTDENQGNFIAPLTAKSTETVYSKGKVELDGPHIDDIVVMDIETPITTMFRADNDEARKAGSDSDSQYVMSSLIQSDKAINRTSRDTPEDKLSDNFGTAPPTSTTDGTSSGSELSDDTSQLQNMKNWASTLQQATAKRRRSNERKRTHRSQPKFKRAKQTTLDKFLAIRASEDGSSEGEIIVDAVETSGTSSSDDLGGSGPEIDRGPVLTKGVSKSALHERRLRAQRLAGTFVANSLLYDKFKIHIEELDPNARYDESNWGVRHSTCGKWIRMSSAYSVKRFTKHLRTCKIKPEFTLMHYSFTAGEVQRTGEMTICTTRPCSGLTATEDSRIKTYLLRLTALGGGGTSRYTIAQQRYGKAYRDLSSRQKKLVAQLNEKEWKWIIKHSQAVVFSTACLKTVRVPVPDEGEDESNASCGPCWSLLRDKAFRRAINKPEPEAINQKFANKEYQYEILGRKYTMSKGFKELMESTDERTSLAVQYAKHVAAGKFDDQGLFTDLVNVLLQKMDRLSKSKKMNNLKYPPLFREFIMTVFLLAPRVHKFLSRFFPMEHVRTIQRRLAREPQFTGGISDRSFDAVDEFVTKVDSPLRHVALSADDTKLLPAFRPFFDRHDQAWYIVGGSGDPLLVVDPEKIRDDLERAQMKKATKVLTRVFLILAVALTFLEQVRAWVISIPLPRIPPIVLAALTITDDVGAETLYEYTTRILEGLHKRNIWVVSYACDGTEKERANQRLLTQRAHAFKMKTIRSPALGIKDAKVDIPLYYARPIAMIQDAKHALKTLRNNLFYGTKTMVFGNYTAQYKDIREITLYPDSPLYIRDVRKTDKQDDRAASRVFSSETFRWLITNRDQNLGTIMYLFVFGELIDAILNRTITHKERYKIVMRASYFVEIWLAFLDVMNYSRKLACLSREALDILRTIESGYQQLIVIYRDHFDAKRVPLVPWLHSTEVVEHIFAECRKEVKDFDFVSFIHMMPRIHSLVRHEMKLEDITMQDPKARASGYAHTWFDLEGISIQNLAIFPSNDEMDSIAKDAYKEAEAIWCELGVFPIEILHHADVLVREVPYEPADESDSDSESAGQENGPLPPFSTLLWNDGDGDDVSDDNSRIVLEQLIEQDEYLEKNGPIRLEHMEKAMLNVSCAKLYLDFDTLIQIDEIKMPSKEEGEKYTLEYRRLVGKVLADSLPDVVDPGPKPLNIHGSSPQLLDLLESRRAHETILAKKGVRLRRDEDHELSNNADGSPECEKKTEKTAYQQLIAKIHRVMRPELTIGTGTGLERNARWIGTEPPGNAANAAAAAAERASKEDTKRLKIYANSSLPRQLTQLLSKAGIDDAHPIREGSFGVVFLDDRSYVARVLSLYSKGGGEHGRHSWTESSESVSRLSYIAVQLFDQVTETVFRELHSRTTISAIRRFAHITSANVLCVFKDTPVLRPHVFLLELSAESQSVWKEIQAFQSRFPFIIKDFRKRGDA